MNRNFKKLLQVQVINDIVAIILFKFEKKKFNSILSFALISIILIAITYCHPVMISSYEAQSKTTSYKALQELMNSVLDSTQLSLKEKEKWMKKFKKHHQDVYIHCYEGDI